jgi:hypothetical protein
VTAAIFGFIGVIVGTAVAAVAPYLLSARNKYGAATVAARLVLVELDRVRHVLDGGDASKVRTLDTPTWTTHAAALAMVLPDAHWTIVSTAYNELDAIRIAAQRNAPVTLDRASTRVSEARQTLLDATQTGRPLHRRGSPLERWLARWPTVAADRDGSAR